MTHLSTHESLGLYPEIFQGGASRSNHWEKYKRIQELYTGIYVLNLPGGREGGPIPWVRPCLSSLALFAMLLIEIEGIFPHP